MEARLECRSLIAYRVSLPLRVNNPTGVLEGTTLRCYELLCRNLESVSETFAQLC